MDKTIQIPNSTIDQKHTEMTHKINTIAATIGTKETLIDMNDTAKFKDLKAIPGKKKEDGTFDEGTLEYDLEANLKPGVKNKDDLNNFNKKYELECKDLTAESTNSEFDCDIFNRIGLNYDKKKHTLELDFDKYSGKTSGNFLQNFKTEDQLKIIEIYFKIESLRYANQQMFNYSLQHKKLFNRLSYIAMVLNFAVPYLPELVGYAEKTNTFQEYSPYFAGASGIIIFISYLFSRTLMSTTANQAYFENMQAALIKLRIAVETVIMGSYPSVATSDKDTKLITYKILQDSELDELCLTKFLTTFLKDINTDLESIYQTNTAITNGKMDPVILDEANADVEHILKIFNDKITNAVETLKQNKNIINAAILASQINNPTSTTTTTTSSTSISNDNRKVVPEHKVVLKIPFNS
jgi:hypothetical protein